MAGLAAGNPLLWGTSKAWAWGSAEKSKRDTKKIPNTHKFILSRAYRLLARDPVFKANQGLFPSLTESLAQEGVRLLEWATGPGPDSPGNSYYSEHYYNPRLPEKLKLPNGEEVKLHKGKAPESVVRHFEGFVQSLILQGKGNPKNVAYGSHYLADMGVPYHVVGAPRRYILKLKESLDTLGIRNCNLDQSIKGEHDGRMCHTCERGGYHDSYKYEVDKFYGDAKDDPATDWFDPWLFNGRGHRVFTSSHFFWELEACLSHPGVGNDGSEIEAPQTSAAPVGRLRALLARGVKGSAAS